MKPMPFYESGVVERNPSFGARRAAKKVLLLRGRDPENANKSVALPGA